MAVTQREVLNLFQVIGAISNSDEILMQSAAGNAAVKITAELFRAYLNQDFTITINEQGFWTVGGSSTGVQATPMLRNNNGDLEVSSDRGYTWEVLIPIDDLMPVLTPAQLATLKLTFADLTPEDIAELQRPATEAAQGLEALKAEVRAAGEEAVRQASAAQAIAEYPPRIGPNHNWWFFDKAVGDYVDSGTRAKQGILYFDSQFDFTTRELVMDFIDQDSEDFIADLFTFADGDLIINIE